MGRTQERRRAADLMKRLIARGLHAQVDLACTCRAVPVRNEIKVWESLAVSLTQMVEVEIALAPAMSARWNDEALQDVFDALARWPEPVPGPLPVVIVGQGTSMEVWPSPDPYPAPGLSQGHLETFDPDPTPPDRRQVSGATECEAPREGED